MIHGRPAIEPLTRDALDRVSLRSIPPTVLTVRYGEYEKQLTTLRGTLSTMMANAKPKGTPLGCSWLAEVDLDVGKPSRIVGHGSLLTTSALASSDWAETTLARWQDWVGQAEACLGIELNSQLDDQLWSQFEADLRILQSNRRELINLLITGGRDPLIPDTPDAVATNIAKMIRANLAVEIKRGAKTPVAAENR